MPTRWTDHPVKPGTQIKRIHVTELRSAIEAARQQYTPPPEGWTPWTDSGLPAGTPVRAVHFTESRTAIQQLWTKKNMGQLKRWRRRDLRCGDDPEPGTLVAAGDIDD